jgi:hypothetical protein
VHIRSVRKQYLHDREMVECRMPMDGVNLKECHGSGCSLVSPHVPGAGETWRPLRLPLSMPSVTAHWSNWNRKEEFRELFNEKRPNSDNRALAKVT